MPVERVSVENLQRGYSGTSNTIDKMHRLAEQGKLDATIQKIANWIRLGVHGDHFGSSRAVADAIFQWVKRHGIFQRDPFQVEKIEHPLASMRPVIEAKQAGKYHGPAVFQGDCDQFAIWVASLGGVLGFQYAFETAKVDDSRPDEFSHVWAALLVGNDWIPLDASTPGARPGWRPPVPPERLKRWEEKRIEEALGMSGLNGHGLGNGKRDVPFSDPAATYDLAPNQPARTPADDMKVSEALYRAPARRPYTRDALMLTEADVPRYKNYGVDRVRRAVEVSKPYPYGWDWNRQVEVVYPGVVGVGAHRRRRAGMSGMGAVTADGAAAPATAPTPQQQAAVEQSLTSQIFGAIGSIANIFTFKSQAQIEEEKRKAAELVSGATAKVTTAMGGTYNPSSPYTLPLAIGAGALGIGALVWFATRTSSPRRRR